jgi:hypothetical protein
LTNEVKGQVFTNEIFARWLVESDTNVDVEYEREKKKREKKVEIFNFFY